MPGPEEMPRVDASATDTLAPDSVTADTSASEAQAAFASAEEELIAITSTGPRWLASTRARPNSPRYPDFLVIGAQKAGTTWLYQNLNFHPSVWLPPIKEVNYFNEIYLPSSDGWESTGRLQQASDSRSFFESRDQLTERQTTKRDALNVIFRNELTDEWYGNIFSFAGDDMLCGEISPDYILLPRAAIIRLIAKNPAAKFIIVLRDPISRVWSHVRMTLSRHPEQTVDMLLNTPALWCSIQGRSNYPALLKRWRSLVNPSNLIVLSFDDIANAPDAFLENLCDRLGVHYDPRFFPNLGGVVREGGTEALPEEMLVTLRIRMRFIYDALEKMYPEYAAPWAKMHYGG